MNKPLVLAAHMLLLITTTVGAKAQDEPRPQGMYCGGNQMVPEGAVRASKARGVILFGDDVMPNARIQVQVKGKRDILVQVQADFSGRFKLPTLRPGDYWLGVSAPGFNLHYWDLTVTRRSGTKALRVALSLGN